MNFYPTPSVLFFFFFFGYILNSCFTVLPFSFVYQTVGVLVKLLGNWGFVSGRTDICLLLNVWTGSGGTLSLYPLDTGALTLGKGGWA